MTLTTTEVRNAKAAEKTRRLYDERGLYLEISPTGRKWWRFKYRFGGREKRLALGVYPDITLKDARERRDEARRLVANDIDPSAHKKAARAALDEQSQHTFEAVAREWFAKQSANWVPSHGDRILRRLERDVFPWLGREPISQISAPTLLGVVRRIESRGALETAHRALRDCGQIFRYAVAIGRAERDPSGDLRGALPPVRGKHFAAVTEPGELSEVLSALDGYKGTLVVRGAFARSASLRSAWRAPACPLG